MIDEEFYRERRRALLSKYLELAEEELGGDVQRSQEHGRAGGNRKWLIVSIIAGLFAVGIVSALFVPTLIRPQTHTTTIFVQEVFTKTVTNTLIYPQPYQYTQPYQYLPAEGAIENIIYSGSVHIDRQCRVHQFPINAKKGDVIRVYWESNDDATYIAIGTDADYEKNVRGSYCETIISLWMWSWPAASYGYSGSLEFTVPSSGSWYVYVANGNWGCILSSCPITVTKLEIRHVQRGV